MTKLNKEQIKSLPTGRSTHHVKLTRLYYPAAIVEFDGLAEVYIQKREKAYKKFPVGEITVIGATYKPDVAIGHSVVIAGDWAEGGETDIEANGSIIVEDYKMEIFSE